MRVRIGRRWRTGSARSLPDDDPRLRLRTIARTRRRSFVNAATVALMQTELLTVRVDLDRPRTRGPRIAGRVSRANAPRACGHGDQPHTGAFASPSSSIAASRILNFCTFPVIVIGNSSTSFRWRGTL